MPNTMWAIGFFVALAAPLFPVAILAVRAFRRQLRHRRSIAWSVALLLSLGANPVAQVPLLEPLDARAGARWEERAREFDIVGKPPEEIRALLGEPRTVWGVTPRILDAEGRVREEYDPYTTWVYKQLPGNWLGSDFQIFFKQGKVSGFEANDD